MLAADVGLVQQAATLEAFLEKHTAQLVQQCQDDTSILAHQVAQGVAVFIAGRRPLVQPLQCARHLFTIRRQVKNSISCLTSLRII